MGTILDSMFEKVDEVIDGVKGGKGSGNWGHAGRKGKRGGSSRRGGGGGNSGIDKDVDKIDSLLSKKSYLKGEVRNFGRAKLVSHGSTGIGPGSGPDAYEVKPNALGKKLGEYVDRNGSEGWKKFDSFISSAVSNGKPVREDDFINLMYEYQKIRNLI